MNGKRFLKIDFFLKYLYINLVFNKLHLIGEETLNVKGLPIIKLILQRQLLKNKKMKKIVLLLLMSLLMIPSEVYSKKYYRTRCAKVHVPTRTPDQIEYDVYLDSETGDLVISPNDAVTGLNIMVTDNGVIYLNTTVSLSVGQSYTDCLDYLSVGTYTLTLSTPDGTIYYYEITIEDV